MKKEEIKSLSENIDKNIILPNDVRDSMVRQFNEGRKHGTKTYIRDIDNISVNGFTNKAWSWKEGEFNIWTGYNGEGKSQFLIFLCILKALNENKKFAFFTPENFPPDDFFDDMIHTILGKTTDRTITNFSMKEDEYIGAYERIKNNFFFVYPKTNNQPDFTIEKIEEVFKWLSWEHGIMGCVLDPYIKIKHQMMPGEPEHLYASRFMMDRINFTRMENLSYHMVMHQLTPRKDNDTGNYPKPSLYSIKGGGTFSDSADNVITVWRPYRGSDRMSTEVLISSDKIKKHKLVGIPSDVQMNFDRKKNRYVSMSGYDYLDGSVDNKQVEIYNPSQFPVNSTNDFEDTPF